MRVVGTRIPTTGEDRKIYSTVDSTATAGQTAFAVNYDEGKVAVWLNGIRLVQGQDFTYTASGVGSQITLSSGIVANDYVEVVGFQGIYSGNALVEDRFVVGTNSTGSGGAYDGSAGNHTTVFPVANNAGDLVCVYRNGIKLVHTTDFVVSASGNTVTLQSASNTADEITVHVIGILQHSNFVPTSGGTFTGTVAHTGTLNVSGGTLTTSTAQKDAIVDGSTAIARSGNNLTFAGEATVTNKLNSSAGNSLTLQAPTGGAVIVNTNGANERVRVTSAGNVGIGTNSPTTFSGYTTVHHKNASGDAINLTETDGGVISQEIVTDASSGSVLIGSRSNHPLRLTVNDSEKVRIDTSGRVGIGITPVEEVHIAGDDPTLLIEHTASSYGEANIRLGNDSGTNASTIQYDTTHASLHIRNEYPVSVGQYGRIFFKQNVGGTETIVGQFDNQDFIVNTGKITGHYAGKVNVQITDDNVYSFTPVTTTGSMLVYCTNDAGDHIYQWFSYEVGGSKWARAFFSNGYVILTTFTGTATTGDITDGYLGLGPSSDGKLYVVNRTGLATSQSYWSIVMIGQ